MPPLRLSARTTTKAMNSARRRLTNLEKRMGVSERLMREMRSMLVGKVRSTNTTGSGSYLNVISKVAQVMRSVV